MTVLIQGAPDLDFIYIRERDESRFIFSTAEVRKILGGASLGEPEVLTWISGYIKDGEPGSL